MSLGEVSRFVRLPYRFSNGRGSGSLRPTCGMTGLDGGNRIIYNISCNRVAVVRVGLVNSASVDTERRVKVRSHPIVSALLRLLSRRFFKEAIPEESGVVSHSLKWLKSRLPGEILLEDAQWRSRHHQRPSQDETRMCRNVPTSLIDNFLVRGLSRRPTNNIILNSDAPFSRRLRPLGSQQWSYYWTYVTASLGLARTRQLLARTD